MCQRYSLGCSHTLYETRFPGTPCGSIAATIVDLTLWVDSATQPPSIMITTSRPIVKQTRILPCVSCLAISFISDNGQPVAQDNREPDGSDKLGEGGGIQLEMSRTAREDLASQMEDVVDSTPDTSAVEYDIAFVLEPDDRLVVQQTEGGG